MKDFFVALSFLTILPVSNVLLEKSKDIWKCIRFFSLVGGFIGIISYLFYYIFSLFFPNGISVVLSIFFYHIINGGLHLDGWADLADAYFGSKKNPERFREILKDSRIGVFGVISLIFYFAIIFASIFENKLDFKFFVAMGMFGRLVIVINICNAKPLFNDGLGKYFIEKASTKELMWGLISTLIVMLLLGKPYVILFFFIILLGYAYKKFVSYYLGGVSGDILGASCIGTEVFFVIIWRAFL